MCKCLNRTRRGNSPSEPDVEGCRGVNDSLGNFGEWARRLYAVVLFFLWVTGANITGAETPVWKFEGGQWDFSQPRTTVDRGLLLADQGVAALPIVISDEARPPERMAATQLRAYLEKITGASFQIVKESTHLADAPAIFVGPVKALAKDLGVASAEELGSEDWNIAVQGGSLYLYGGYPRGTLYAVFHFLEDELGVHWWTPESETIPQESKLVVARTSRAGQPVFGARTLCYFYAAERKSRDIFEGAQMVSAVKYDGGLFAARNRINNQGNIDYQIDPEYGGEVAFGPPSFCHTYYRYIDPKDHFDLHPDWFSLVDGKRRHEAAQLDVMNPGLRTFFRSKLLENIQKTVNEDAARGGLSRQIFDISPNDHEGYDEGDASRELVRREGSQMGPLLDFVNYLAGAVQERFPEVRLETLAYKATEEPPRTMRAADNVIITVADTASNPARALTAPGNGQFLDLLKRWKLRAKHLRVWDYANAYGVFGGGLPMPMASTIYADLQAYAKIGVEGLLIEIGEPWSGADRDFLNWVTMKGLENPQPEFAELERTFTEGFFGPAGASLREYYTLLRAAANSSKADGLTPFGGHFSKFAYLDLAFLLRSNELFDAAENAVKKVTNNAEAMARVRKVRLSVDEAILRGYSRGLLDEWRKQGGSESDFPLPMKTVLLRYEETLRSIVKAAVLPERLASWNAQIDDKIVTLTPRVTAPLDFPRMDSRMVFDYLPDQMSWSAGLQPIQSPLIDSVSGSEIIARPVEDKAADAGVALEVRISHPEKGAKSSWLWSYFGLSEEKVCKGEMPMEEIGTDYQWVKLGGFPSVQRGLVSLFVPADSPVGAVRFNTDYYSDLAVAAPEENCELWMKVRRVDRKDDAPFYRISRAVILKK